jgi:hypothetical protein
MAFRLQQKRSWLRSGHFRWYGFLGILLIILVEANFFLRAEPFASWYFPIVWFGYILTVDAMIYKLRRDSLISTRPYQFLGMVFMSVLFWWIFEFLNLGVRNWDYAGLEDLGTLKNLFGSISFSTVLPALFETVELIRSVHLFDKARLRTNHNISRGLLRGMILIGIACFFLPVLFPKYAFPLVWLSLFFILDPINYLHKQPSITGHLKDRKLTIPLSLLLAGIILGFLWEFWNFWAVPRWTYDVPFVGFFKIFEMPILGYLGYFPFSWELYAMYWFVRSLFTQKQEHLLAD